MSNTQGDDEAYPSNTPFEDEPERFISGSRESNDANERSSAGDPGGENDRSNDSDGDAEVNDG